MDAHIFQQYSPSGQHAQTSTKARRCITDSSLERTFPRRCFTHHPTKERNESLSDNTKHKKENKGWFQRMIRHCSVRTIGSRRRRRRSKNNRKANTDHKTSLSATTTLSATTSRNRKSEEDPYLTDEETTSISEDNDDIPQSPLFRSLLTSVRQGETVGREWFQTNVVHPKPPKYMAV